MANEKDDQRKITSETIESLKIAQQANAQQDLNSEFKDSINLLKKINSLIEDSVSKTQTLEKSAINTNKLKRELEKIEKKQATTQRELNQANQTDKVIAEEYLKNVKDRNKVEEELLKRRSLGLNVSSLQNDLRQIEAKISSTILQNGQIDLIAKMQANELLKERVATLEEEIVAEKKIESSVGLIGKSLKLMNKYLLFGKDTYGKMVEEARGGEISTKKWIGATSILAAGIYVAFKALEAGVGIMNKAVTAITGSGGPLSKLVSPFTDLISKIPLIGGLLGGVLDMLINVADFATESSSAIQKFGRNLGYSEQEATKLNNRFSDLAHSSGDLLYNSRKIRESATELYDALGITKGLSDQIVLSNIKLKELGELDLETRKELAIVTLNTGRDQDKLAKTLYGQTKSLEKTLGVSFKWQQILKEASSLSGYLGLSFTKYPEKLQKSLMIVKATGLEMKQLDNIANSLLDYESSIASEFEAQLMTGKNINLAKARELFLNNQLAEAAQEITKQVGTSEEFLQLNRFGAEALAKSFGMSRDELGNMLKQQELFAKVGATDLKTYQQRLVTLNATVQGQKELVSLIGEQEYSNFMNQTATEKIANFMDKIRQSFADLLNNSSFKGFINKILDFLASPEQIDSMIKKLTGFVSLMIRSVAEIVNGLDYVVRVSSLGFGDIDNSIIDRLRGAAAAVGNMNMGIMTNSPAPTTVGGAVAKGSANASTVNVSQGSMGGGAYTGPKILELNVTGKINTQDERTFASFTAKGLSTPYGNSDLQTGNFNAY
jgi:hypothetical protein